MSSNSVKLSVVLMLITLIFRAKSQNLVEDEKKFASCNKK